MLIENIRHQTYDFSFVDKLASFVNNLQFRNGYDNLKQGVNDKSTYIWNVLSSIGNDYANVIYENVLNYLDNASNVDLCKLTALQSMLKIMGISYEVLNSYQGLPVEIANLMDILSINKNYLLKSTKFAEVFIDELSDYGCIKTTQLSSTLSSEIDETKGISSLANYSEQSCYLDNDTYKEFLIHVYTEVINNYVYMQYADAENNLSTLHTYIYEYIGDQLYQDITTKNNNIDSHVKEMQQLIAQYSLNKAFDYEGIVDNIENSLDSINNYNKYEQLVIQAEIDYRKDSYVFNKTYLDDEKFLGYNITRYSYYREKKVKEYFKFVENMYSNMLNDNKLNDYLTDQTKNIYVYDKDENFFRIDQENQIHLLEYNSDESLYTINTIYINSIAKLLAEQTLEIADLREQLKIQMQKNYIKGTFLLVSYLVNEFLKYNISNKFGDKFYTEDSISLKTMLDSCLSDNDNIKLIEYYDDTEYFNLSTENDNDAVNGHTSNEHFWNTSTSKVGKTTNDLPLEDIENFYLETMKLNKRQVSDLADFLTKIFEYGVNPSYIKATPRNEQIDDSADYLDFVTQIHDGRFIGNPYKVIERIEQNILSVQKIYDNIQLYVEDGYQLSDTIDISSQIDDLTAYLSVYYEHKIREFNEDLVEEQHTNFAYNRENLQQYIDSTQKLSDDYEALKVDKRYAKFYFDAEFEELTAAYLKQKLDNFHESVEYGFTWNYAPVTLCLDEYLKQYQQLSSELYNKLFTLSVWNKGSSPEYWPYYMPDYEAEITSVTEELGNYLNAQVEQNKQDAMAHITAHYNKILGYKEDLNNAFQMCIAAKCQLDAYKAAVEAGTGIKLTEDYSKTYTVWDDVMYKTTVVLTITKGEISEGEDDTYDTEEVVGEDVYAWTLTQDTCESEGINSSDTFEEQLDKIYTRCHCFEYTAATKKDEGALMDGVDGCGSNDFDYEHEGFQPCTQAEAKIFKYRVAIENGEDSQGYTKYKAHSVQDYYWYPIYKKDTKIYAYEPSTKRTLWGEYYSASVSKDILSKLDDAINSLKTTIGLINSEYECLGRQDLDEEAGIDLNDLTRENIKTNVETALEQLIEDIDDIDDGVLKENHWKTMCWTGGSGRCGDKQLWSYAKRIQRISDITLSSPIAYNIRYFDSRFDDLLSALQTILDDNFDFFDSYAHDSTKRYDKQIQAMYAYCKQKGATCSAEVLEIILDLLQQHQDILLKMVDYGNQLTRTEVSSINDDYSYNLETIYYNFFNGTVSPYLSNYIDALLSANYIDTIVDLSDCGIIQWIANSYQQLEDSIATQIHLKIPTLSAYINTIDLMKLAKTKYLAKYLSCYEYIDEKLLYVNDLYRQDIAYISSEIPTYDKNYEIFLKYSGMDIGYDPYYNYKNMAYSSYQIHPYLYSFVEKSNIAYPLAKNFLVAFSETYEQDLYKYGIDTYIGQYGNVINLWKNGMYDFTGHKTKYETTTNNVEASPNIFHGNMNFTGAFYPPALDAFLNNTDKFIQDLEENNESSYYYHLNLSETTREKIANQLIEYENAIREIVQWQKDETIEPSLSGEYDIYKYAEDIYGNSLILYKSYRHLYESHREGYIPSYNDKKNTPGELWMRIKDHPLAFPAFDTRSGYEEVSQYCIKQTKNGIGQDINTYIPEINEFFSSIDSSEVGEYEILGQGKTMSLFELTKDAIGMTATEQSSNLRCFLDMELDPFQNSIVLAVPYPTGTETHKEYTYGFKYPKTFTYANCSLIVGSLEHEYNSALGQDIYSCATQKIDDNPVDDIDNPGQLYIDSNSEMKSMYIDQTLHFEYVGTFPHDLNLYSVFICKYNDTNTFSNKDLQHSKSIILNYNSYRYQIQSDDHLLTIPGIKYDVFSNKVNTDVEDNNRYPAYDYRYANVIVGTVDNNQLTLGYVSSKIQTSKYLTNDAIVNYIEYSNMLESDNIISTYGENTAYPRDTAMLQTDDEEHINIYNSFDSFTQYLVNVHLKISGNRLSYSDEQLFNLHTDIGYYPVYNDLQGTTRFSENPTLKNQKQFNIELLGPENSDVAYTPVIVDPAADATPRGRVTEDFKAMDQRTTTSSQKIVPKESTHTTFIWSIKDLLGDDEYADLTESTEIFEYRYMVFNTDYQQVPMLKGALSVQNHTGYYYSELEEFEKKEGQEIIGPNKETYQNIENTNHIANIKSVAAKVLYDNDEGFPISVQVDCYFRNELTDDTIIKKDQFTFSLYHLNSLNTYKFYHLFENDPNPDIPHIPENQIVTQDEEYYKIDFNDIEVPLSLYTIPATNKQPFADYTGNTDPLKIVAPLEFKYSEEDQEYISGQFPTLSSNVSDEVVIPYSENTYQYFFQLDNFFTLSVDPITMRCYNPSTTTYYNSVVDIYLNKYQDFFSRIMKIDAMYNLELKANSENIPTTINNASNYEIVLYFNYKNYTNPGYIEFEEKPGQAPKTTICTSKSEVLNDTYLVLRPNEEKRLDIKVQCIKYGRLNPKDLDYSIIGCGESILTSYYVLNTSDSKPKFLISKIPFNHNVIAQETGHYEMLADYKKGTYFRYVKIVIESNRGGNYLSFSKTTFFNQKDQTEFEFPENSTITIQNAVEVFGHEAKHLIDGSNISQKYFLATWDTTVYSTMPTINIIIDMKSQCLDVETYDIWRWYTAKNSKSHGGFLPHKFRVLFSTDMQLWYQGNAYEDIGDRLPKENSILAYGRPGYADEGKIVIKAL